MKLSHVLMVILSCLSLSCATRAFNDESEELSGAEIESIKLDKSKFYCPPGYTISDDANLCTNKNKILMGHPLVMGPFTNAMKAACKSAFSGNNKFCDEDEWPEHIVKKFRGNDVCMPGSTLQKAGLQGAAKTALGLCKEGDHAFGPFSAELVKRCDFDSTGNACQTMRIAYQTAVMALNRLVIDLTPKPAANSDRGISNKSAGIKDKTSAFLDVIAYAEGVGNHYDYLVGFGIFKSFKDHPRIYVRAADSDAAGRYQIMSPTWDGLRRNFPGVFTDFSPQKQDLAAIKLAAEKGVNFERITDRASFEQAIHDCRKLWASFPGAGYGQQERKMDTLWKVYKAHGG